MQFADPFVCFVVSEFLEEVMAPFRRTGPRGPRGAGGGNGDRGGCGWLIGGKGGGAARRASGSTDRRPGQWSVAWKDSDKEAPD